MGWIFTIILAIIAQIGNCVQNKFPEQSKQLISSTVETDCFANSSFESNKFKYPISSITSDAENSNSFTLTGWFKSIGHQQDGDSIIFFITKDLSKELNTDVIFYFGFNEQTKKFFYSIGGALQNIVSQPLNLALIDRNKWFFLSVSFKMDPPPINKYNLIIIVKQSSNNLQIINDIQSISSFTFYFNDSVFLLNGGLVLSSIPKVFPSYNPSCVQMKNIQVHWNYIFTAYQNDLQASESMIINYPAKLKYHFTMEKDDLFIQSSNNYLRNRSPEENHLIIDNLQASVVDPFIEFNKSKTLSGMNVNDGFIISYWIRLSTSSPDAITVATILLGDGTTQLQIQHKFNGSIWEIQILSSLSATPTKFASSSFTPSPPTTNSNWNFYLFVFKGGNIQVYTLNSINTLSEMTLPFSELDNIKNNNHEYVKIQIGSQSNQNLKLRDLKILRGIAVFTYSFEGLHNCQLSYGLETKQCLICKASYSITNEGTCTTKCPVLSPPQPNQDFIPGFLSKCLSCPSSQNLLIDSYDNQCSEILGYYDSLQQLPLSQNFVIPLDQFEVLILINQITDTSIVISDISSTPTAQTINSSKSIKLDIHKFQKKDKITSGITKVQSNKLQFISFKTIFKTPPKVIISLLAFDLSQKPQLKQKKVSTEGFYVEYSALVSISWIALPSCLEVVQALYENNGSKMVIQNFQGQINYASPVQIYAINSIYQTNAQLTLPTKTVFSATTNYYIDQTQVTNSPDFGFDIGYIFNKDFTVSKCSPLSDTIPFSQMNILSAQKTSSNSLLPDIFNVRFRTPKPVTDYQILFALKNYDKQKQIFSYSINQRYFSYKYLEPTFQSDYYYFTIRHPGVISTKIYQITTTSGNQKYTIQLDQQLTSKNVKILPSIINWEGGNSIEIAEIQDSDINLDSFLLQIISNQNLSLQIQFMIIQDSFTFRLKDYQILKSISSDTNTLPKDFIFGVTKITKNQFSISVTNPTSGSSTIKPDSQTIWILKGVQIDPSNNREDKCILFRNEDFKCEQCKNQLLYGNNKKQMCTCPVGFGFQQNIKKCVRCKVGCQYCVFQDDSTTSECLECNTDASFYLEQGVCKCNPSTSEDDKDSNYCVPKIDQLKDLPKIVVKVPKSGLLAISAVSGYTSSGYAYIGISLDVKTNYASLAIYLPQNDYWIYQDAILSVSISSFLDTKLQFSGDEENSFIFGTTIIAQKQAFTYHVKHENQPLLFFSVADAKFDTTRYVVTQNKNIFSYKTDNYQQLLLSTTPYLKFPDSMKDEILAINYQQLGYGVKGNQYLVLDSKPTITGSIVVSFWVKSRAQKLQDEDVVLAKIGDRMILGRYFSNGLIYQVVVCINKECQNVNKWYVDNQNWNQLSFIFEVTSNFNDRKGTIVRAFYKVLEQKLYFDQIPDDTGTTDYLTIGNSINTVNNQGFYYNFFTLLTGSYYKYKNSIDTVKAKYCSLNAGKFYNYCLKCSYQNPRTDHLCATLPNNSSCFSIEDTDGIAKGIYEGRDPYLYYPNYDACERCVTERCAVCETTIDNCTKSCQNQCKKCIYNQEWKCSQCRGNRSVEPTCTTCKDPNTADDYLSENCQCKNSCKVCKPGDTSPCGCSNTVEICNECAENSNRSFKPLCACKFGFYDVGKPECEKCSSKCTRCQDQKDKCIQCSGNRSNPPICPCPDYTYEDYDAKTGEVLAICKNCPKNCINCVVNSTTKELECAKCRFRSSWNGKRCVCNDGFYDDQQVDNCSQCDILCEKCERPGRCTSCLGKRILNSSGQCVCPDGYYGNSKLAECKPCYFTCRTCYGDAENQCKSCYQDPYVRLRKGKCVCANEGLFFNTFEKKCVLYTTFKYNLYYDKDIMPVLSLNFTNPLSTSAEDVLKNMVFEIEGLKYNKDFKTSIFYLNQGRIDIKFILSVSFRPTILKVTVIDPDAVIDKYKTPLHRKYTKYTMQFNLYPHHQVDNDKLQYLQNMRSFSTSVYDREGFGIDFVWLLQLMAFQNFLFNSMQPTSMILLYNHYLPINVYETLRAFSILQYQNVPIWGEFGYDDTMILRKSSKEITDAQIPETNVRRLGYSSSFFINFLRQLFLYGIMWFGFYLVKLRFLNEKYAQDQDKKLPWLETFYQIFLYYMSKVTEAFFVTLTIVVFMQIRDPSFSQAFNGISYLLNFIYLASLCGIFYFFYDQVRNTDISDIDYKNLACRSLGNMLLDLKLSDSFLVKYYHMITYFKKLFYSIIIIFAVELQENHVIPLIIIEVLFLIFFVILRPLFKPIYNIVRALIQILYIGILVFILLLGKGWVSMTQNQVIIDASDAESYYQQGKLLLILLLVYNLISIIFTTVVAALHFYEDYVRSQREKIKEKVFDNLKNQKLFNYQELQEVDQYQRRDSLMRIIDLQDNRKVNPLPLQDIEQEIQTKNPFGDDERISRQESNQKLTQSGFYTIVLRKDIIWRNFIDPINKSFTIAVETVETLGAKRQANPILNKIETNVVVDYSNTSKVVYKNGQEEFRVLSSLLSKWKVQKNTKIQREVSCVINLSQYSFGSVIDITTPLRDIDYYLVSNKFRLIL